MAPNESSAITELTQELRDFIADFRVFRTKLMGDDKSEDDQGRIPRIEAAVLDLTTRLVRMESLGWMAHGIAWLIGVIAGAAGTIYYFSKLITH